MSFSTDLLQGLAADIVNAGIAVLHTGPYLPTDTGLFYGRMGDKTDRCVVLNDYPVSDEPTLPIATVGVQIRTRGGTDPFDEKGLRDAIYQLFQGMTNRTYGTVHVIQMLRHSAVPLGEDEHRRWISSQNFYVDVDVPQNAYRTT